MWLLKWCFHFLVDIFQKVEPPQGISNIFQIRLEQELCLNDVEILSLIWTLCLVSNLAVLVLLSMTCLYTWITVSSQGFCLWEGKSTSSVSLDASMSLGEDIKKESYIVLCIYTDPLVFPITEGFSLAAIWKKLLLLSAVLVIFQWQDGHVTYNILHQSPKVLL